MSTRWWGGGRLLALLGFWLPASAFAQDRVPAFPSEAEAITVDVVVLDKDGRPVRGLKRSDFTILEDGSPQPVVGFETRDLASAGGAATAASDAAGLPRAEGELAEGVPGRRLAFIVDDVGLDPRGIAAINAVRDWAREKADPRDELTLSTTSGEVEWSGRIGTGRGELLRALGRIRCHGGRSAMTEWQAYQAVSRGQGAAAASAEATGNAEAAALTAASGRFGERKGELPDLSAQDIYNRWQRRASAVVSAIERFSRAHASERGRKSIFVFTQGFIRDDSLKPAEQAIDAAQRGNTPLYFVDARGLVAGDRSGGGLFGDNVQEVVHHVDLAGGEHMAVETGGAILRDTNDLVGRLGRAVDESSAYYLLGYQPAQAPDGKWHKLEVKVGVKDATVRARRGYYASARPLSEQLARADSPPEASPVPADRTSDRAGTKPDVLPPSAPEAVESPSPAQAGSGVPAFPSQAEAITVDVVVLDPDGRPVKDLTTGDFTLLEDGRPQSIIGFEPRALTPRDEVSDAKTSGDDGVATNQRPAGPAGRTLAFLIDDLGIEPLQMIEAAKALRAWLATSADPRDDVTLATSSGDAWWSDTVGAGRNDFEAVLGRVTGKKRLASAQDSLSDWEAYSIDTYGSPGDDPVAPGGLNATAASTGPPTGTSQCTSGGPTGNMRDRVVDRWFRSGVCVCDPMNVAAAIRSCRAQVQGRARDVYTAAAQRAAGLLATVERVSRGLSAARGRKSVIVLSGGLLRDTEQRAFERAVDASRRGNTAVSFVDVRGLIGLPIYGADQSVPPKPGDVGAVTVETTLLETAGGEYLAETTGGSTVRNTNDIAGNVTRLADESSAYYLLGYQSDRPLDGRWRKLQVKVSRPGLEVRARRGYFATSADVPAIGGKPSKKKDEKGKGGNLPVRLLDPSLSVGGGRDEIPLRLAPYVFETDASGTARLLVAIEVDTAALSFGGTGAQRTARLDVTLLGVSRDHSKTVPLDSHVELSVNQTTLGSWWIFTRELRLPPGAAQIRVLVRDTVSGRSGLVSRRVEIPRPDAPYLSTPILTDRLAPARGMAGSPQLMPTAHRRFQPRGHLYCAYEVYVAPGAELKVIPRIAGGYTIEDETGQVVVSAPPTPIAIALGAQVVRTIAIPLDRLDPGRYHLIIKTADQDTGASLEAREAFVIEPQGGPATRAN